MDNRLQETACCMAQEAHAEVSGLVLLLLHHLLACHLLCHDSAWRQQWIRRDETVNLEQWGTKMSLHHDQVCVCVNAQVHRTDTMSNQKLDCPQLMRNLSNDMSAQIEIGKTDNQQNLTQRRKRKENSLRDTSLSVNSTHSKESEAATLYALTTWIRAWKCRKLYQQGSLREDLAAAKMAFANVLL